MWNRTGENPSHSLVSGFNALVGILTLEKAFYLVAAFMVLGSVLHNFEYEQYS